MTIKEPPQELILMAKELLAAPVHERPWKYKRVVHMACAPWIVPCYHTASDSYEYVNLNGCSLSDGRLYAVGECPRCGTIIWAETTR